MGRSTVLLHNKQSTLMQNPAVLLSWDIFQNPFPHFEIQHLLGNTQGILIYFSANEEG